MCIKRVIVIRIDNTNNISAGYGAMPEDGWSYNDYPSAIEVFQIFAKNAIQSLKRNEV